MPGCYEITAASSAATSPPQKKQRGSPGERRGRTSPPVHDRPAPHLLGWQGKVDRDAQARGRPACGKRCREDRRVAIGRFDKNLRCATGCTNIVQRLDVAGALIGFHREISMECKLLPV